MDAAEYDFGPIPEMDPVRKFAVLVLWQAQQDRGTELVIGKSTSSEGVPIRYLVDGNWYEMAPFPEHVRPQLERTIIEMANGVSVRFPSQGMINEHVTERIHLHWTVRLDSPGADICFHHE